MKATIKVTGAQQLRARLRRMSAQIKASGKKGVRVGIFDTARYQDTESERRSWGKGERVSLVAARNEYGVPSERIPPRPFFRLAIKNRFPKATLRVLKGRVRPDKMYVDSTTATLLGTVLQAELQQSIIKLKDPPNAPMTIKIKGSSNPLVDTGKLVRSVSFKLLAGTAAERKAGKAVVFKT